MAPADWDRVAEIFAEGIATGDSTFETEVPAWERWDATTCPSRGSWRASTAASWAGARRNRTSIRDVYRGVAEVSVYVAEEARGEGVGEPLLTALAEAAHDAGPVDARGHRHRREHRQREDGRGVRLPPGGPARAPRASSAAGGATCCSTSAGAPGLTVAAAACRPRGAAIGSLGGRFPGWGVRRGRAAGTAHTRRATSSWGRACSARRRRRRGRRMAMSMEADLRAFRFSRMGPKGSQLGDPARRLIGAGHDDRPRRDEARLDRPRRLHLPRPVPGPRPDVRQEPPARRPAACPVADLIAGRSPSLDLDSLYGLGPTLTPEFYARRQGAPEDRRDGEGRLPAGRDRRTSPSPGSTCPGGPTGRRGSRTSATTRTSPSRRPTSRSSASTTGWSTSSRPTASPSRSASPTARETWS